MKPVQKGTQNSAKGAPETSKKPKGFTDEEKEAMREFARERAGNPEGESAVLAKIAEMPEPDRTIAKRLHAIIKDTAPSLGMRTWYGMPAYTKDGDVLCFFQGAYKFKGRYATLGFTDRANLDQGQIWSVVYALKKLTAAEEPRIIALVKKAVS